MNKSLLFTKTILEVGTAIGFSALLMSEYGPRDCHITTIEKYEVRIPIARENFKKAAPEQYRNRKVVLELFCVSPYLYYLALQGRQILLKTKNR